MYSFQEISNGNYKIQKTDGVCQKGSLAQVKEFMVSALEFCPYEIDIALEEMRKSRHSKAEFGVLKGFMFTFEPDLLKYDA